MEKTFIFIKMFSALKIKYKSYKILEKAFIKVWKYFFICLIKPLNTQMYYTFICSALQFRALGQSELHKIINESGCWTHPIQGPPSRSPDHPHTHD